jgi:hypothetical protein
MTDQPTDSVRYLRNWAGNIRAGGGYSADAERLDSIADEIDRLQAALTEIRDIMPLQNDEYARKVFAIAANTLEPN